MHICFSTKFHVIYNKSLETPLFKQFKSNSENSNNASNNGSSNSTADGSVATENDASNSASNTAISNMDKTEQPLPSGWEVSYTDKGRMFFIDHNSKATTWVTYVFF